MKVVTEIKDINLTDKITQDVTRLSLAMLSEENYNPRVDGLIEQTVVSLVDSQTFPPIHVGLLNKKLIVIDGYHRLEATKRLGLDYIDCYITPYKTLSELKRDSINENINHGVRLNDYDIAFSMVKLFNELAKANMLVNTTLVQFLSNFKMEQRRAKSLFKWGIVNFNILESDSRDIKRVTVYEDIFSMIEYLGDTVQEITNETKTQIKEFCFRYGSMNRNEIREALKLFKEGKDYNEEQDRIRKEAMEVEKIASVTPASETKIEEETPQEKPKESKTFEINNDLKEKETTVEENIEKAKETTAEIQEKVKEKTQNKIKCIGYLNEISTQLMSLYMLQEKGKLEDLTKEHIDLINDIQDRLEELTAPYYSNLNKENK